MNSHNSLLSIVFVFAVLFGAFSTAEPETEYREEMPADERHYFPQMRWQRPAMLPYEIESADRLKKWASQLRFGKRASWASKVRFG